MRLVYGRAAAIGIENDDHASARGEIAILA